MFSFRKVPDEESDGEVALCAIEALDGEDESAHIGILEEAVAYFLVVVGVEVLQLREHAKVGLPVPELLRDAEEELREELTARLAVVLGVHPFADRGHGDRVLGLLARFASNGVGGGERRIDEDDPLDVRVREVGGEVRRHLARLSEGHLPCERGDVVLEVVVLEARRGGENLLAVLGILHIDCGDVAVPERGGRQPKLEVACAGCHVPEADVAALPPFAADGALDVFKGLPGEFDGREELAREAAAEVLGEAVGHLADTHHGGWRHLLVVLPEVAVLLGLERLGDVALCAAHGEEDPTIMRVDGFALLDVSEEVLGRLAPVADVGAEETVPVLEHVEEVLLGDGLLVEKVDEGGLLREAFAALGDELLLLCRAGEVVDVDRRLWNCGIVQLWNSGIIH